MESSSTSSSGPNPLCEVGRRHPRDRHRMRPLDGYEHVWSCAKHSMFATLVDKDVADGLHRGDDYVMHDGENGRIEGHGDERQGAMLIYYRAR